MKKKRRTGRERRKKDKFCVQRFQPGANSKNLKKMNEKNEGEVQHKRETKKKCSGE